MLDLANQLFSAAHKVMLLEDQINTALSDVGIVWSDWTFDAYDMSIEIFGCDAALTPEQQAALWRVGFVRAWTHPGEAKVKVSEKYYMAPVNAETN